MGEQTAAGGNLRRGIDEESSTNDLFTVTRCDITNPQFRKTIVPQREKEIETAFLLVDPLGAFSSLQWGERCGSFRTKEHVVAEFHEDANFIFRPDRFERFPGQVPCLFAGDPDFCPGILKVRYQHGISRRA